MNVDMNYKKCAILVQYTLAFIYFQNKFFDFFKKYF